MGAEQSKIIPASLKSIMNVTLDSPDFRDILQGTPGLSSMPGLSHHQATPVAPAAPAAPAAPPPSLSQSIDWRHELDIAPFYQTCLWGDSIACSLSSLLYSQWISFPTTHKTQPISRRWIHMSTFEIDPHYKWPSQQVCVPFSIRQVLKSVKKLGLVDETLCPSRQVEDWIAPFSPETRQAAHPWTISYRRLAFDELITTLLQKKLVLTSISVFSNFLQPDTRSSGYLPPPSPDIDSFLGMISIVIVGFHPKTQRWIVRFHFGSLWGDHGYGYLDRDYLLHHARDYWTVNLQYQPEQPNPDQVTNQPIPNVSSSEWNVGQTVI